MWVTDAGGQAVDPELSVNGVDLCPTCERGFRFLLSQVHLSAAFVRNRVGGHRAGNNDFCIVL